MRRHVFGLLLITLGVLIGLLTVDLVLARASTPVAVWNMNSLSGPLKDDAGGRYPAAVGSEVGRNGVWFSFGPVDPDAPRDAQRLVTMSSSLSPGTGPWELSLRFRTYAEHSNVVNKGQAGSGTYFKLEMPYGVPSCLFRGEVGSRSVNAGVRADDGQWHTLSCRRDGTSVTMTMDGHTRTATGATGRIANGVVLSLGGKARCTGGVPPQVGCDYWTGDVDWMRIDR